VRARLPTTPLASPADALRARELVARLGEREREVLALIADGVPQPRGGVGSAALAAYRQGAPRQNHAPARGGHASRGESDLDARPLRRRLHRRVVPGPPNGLVHIGPPGRQTLDGFADRGTRLRAEVRRGPQPSTARAPASCMWRVLRPPAVRRPSARDPPSRGGRDDTIASAPRRHGAGTSTRGCGKPTES
jgi:hypothetical protein